VHKGLFKVQLEHREPKVLREPKELKVVW